MTGWNDPITAQAYDSYSKTFPGYHLTSRDLVRLAQVEQSNQVVDLACGTGTTSGALLELLTNTGHIHAVDLSSAMLAIAQKNIQASNLTFYHCGAEDLHEIIPPNIDIVVCNSAFWQMDSDKTLRSIKQILAADGRFAFNIPHAFSPICDDQKQPVNLRALMRQVAQEEFGLTFNEPLRERSSTAYTADGIKQILAKNGYTLLRHERLSYEGERESAKAFLTIPIMTESTLPGVAYETRLEILERAYGRLDSAAEKETSAWDFYVVGLDEPYNPREGQF